MKKFTPKEENSLTITQRQALVVSQHKLVWKVANYLLRNYSKKMYREYVDDLVQAGHCGLVIASRYYVPGGATFSTYAHWWVRREEAKEFRKLMFLLGYREAKKENKHFTSVGSLSYKDQDDGKELSHSVEDKHPHSVSDWDGLVKFIRPRWREILRLHFEEERSYAEIGRIVGLVRQRVQQITEQALAILRDKLADQEFLLFW